MSFSSSYRRLFSDSPRFSTSGLRAEGARASSSGQFSASTSGQFSASSSGQYQLRRTGGAVQFQSRPAGGAVSALSLADALDLGHTSKLNNELRVTRSNEKQQLQGLNDRFALFIEKVRALETQNRALEAELQCLRQKQAESRVSQVWTDQIRTLRDQIQILNQDQDRLTVEREHQEGALQRLSAKLSEEARLREEAELALRALMKDVDEAAVTRLELERRVESLNQEIDFMKKLHQEELEELQRDYDNKVAVEAELSRPSLTSDLSSALREIRAQYEAVSLKNQAETESWFRSRCRSLEEQASRSGEVVRQSREEIGDFRRELQSRTIEIQSLRAANESLERQRREAEDRHAHEVTALQETIAHLDAELRDLKGEMAEHLREYQDLLNVKMALDIEIAAYRKLLEGEETHFNSGLSFGAFVEPRAVGGASSRERKPRRDKKEEEEKPEETQTKLLLHE